MNAQEQKPENPIEEPPKVFDTEYTTFPVCPHCGHVDCDLCEIVPYMKNEVDEETTCGICGEPFRRRMETDIKFCTGKVEEETK